VIGSRILIEVDKMPNDTNLKLRRGDNKGYLLHFTDDNEADIDITGWTVFFTASDDPSPENDDAAQIKKTITAHTVPLEGKTTINLSPTDTNLLGDFYYDIQVKRLDGSIITVLSGLMTFYADQTRRTS